jgi:hypothetical protein
MSFGFLIYRGKTGVALATETDPNALALDPTMAASVSQARVQPSGGGGPSQGTVGRFAIVAKGGTTADIQMWFYEATTKSWWPFGPKVTVTPAAPVMSDGARVDGAAVYAQIVANTNVEQLGVWYS